MFVELNLQTDIFKVENYKIIKLLSNDWFLEFSDECPLCYLIVGINYKCLTCPTRIRLVISQGSKKLMESESGYFPEKSKW